MMHRNLYTGKLAYSQSLSWFQLNIHPAYEIDFFLSAEYIRSESSVTLKQQQQQQQQKTHTLFSWTKPVSSNQKELF